MLSFSGKPYDSHSPLFLGYLKKPPKLLGTTVRDCPSFFRRALIYLKELKKCYSFSEGIASKPNDFLPFDIHCREGKDRCGAMVALLLLALGVSEEDVISDFLVTNVNLASDNSVRPRPPRPPLLSTNQTCLRALLGLMLTCAR